LFLFFEHVVECAGMTAFDDPEVVAGRFEEPDEHRHAHVTARERLHARERCTSDARAFSKVFLREARVAARLLEHLSNVCQIRHL
jgi:hypothetical protein